MKPGSLVVYIGGQTQGDISAGCGLSKDVVYEVDQVGYGMVNGRKMRCLTLVERGPMEYHLVRLFREVQGPGAVDISELMRECEEESQVVRVPAPPRRELV